MIDHLDIHRVKNVTADRGTRFRLNGEQYDVVTLVITALDKRGRETTMSLTLYTDEGRELTAIRTSDEDADYRAALDSSVCFATSMRGVRCRLAPGHTGPHHYSRPKKSEAR